MNTTTQTQSQTLNKNVYELMENDDGEVMLLLYADGDAPQNPTFFVNEERKWIELTRNKNDIVYIEGLQTETVEKLKKLTVLYACEMKYNENPDAENEIQYAYAAELRKSEKKAPVKKNDTSGENLSEKVRQAREKVLKKESV